MTTDPPRHTPLFERHEELDARLTDFGGWEMPVSYTGVVEEHHTVRDRVGLFDVSHMSEVEVSGPDAEALMQRLTTNDVQSIAPGEAQYALITDETGVLLDDTLVYRRDASSFLFVPNAGHDAEMTDRWTTHRDAWEMDATVENATDRYAMLAVQGPDAPEAVAALSDADLDGLGRFSFTDTPVAGVDCLVSNTGYTGEAGYELLCASDDAVALWDALVEDCEPCGLGARDTLRTEMGYLLSGQDFDPDTDPRTPYEAEVGFAVDLESDFVGRDALARQVDAGGPAEILAGFALEARGVPRHGYAILDDAGESVGTVTSGTMSPTLSEPIGLGYLPVELAEPGRAVAVEIRGDAKPATVRATPFITPDGPSP
mgnify:CR=1 FL=1